MECRQIRDLFLDALDQSRDETTKEEFAAAIREVPAGQYMCGCEWSGGIVPHYCPKHQQPVCFVIQEPDEGAVDIPWLPSYLDTVYGKRPIRGPHE
jgi:hypothetical protein